MRTVVGAWLVASSVACVGPMPDMEERDEGRALDEPAGQLDLPGTDPGTARGATLVLGAPICAPCSSDDACGAETDCNEPRGVCEHVRGYCDSNTRGLRPLDEIDRIVIHTSEGPADAAVGWLLSSVSGVSAHYAVDSEGWVGALVSEAAAARHTGNIAFDRRSIGIELEGFVDRPAESYTAAMYDAVAALVRDVAARYGMPLDREHVVGHIEVPDAAPGAEFCGGWSHHGDPGDGFDWGRFMALLRGESLPELAASRWLERAPFDPEILAVIHSPSAHPGEVLEVTLQARNAGRAVWEQSRLRLVATDDGASELFLLGQWASRARPYLGGLGCHGPDTTAELSFWIRAPDAAQSRTAGGAFQLELFDRSGALRRSGDFDVLLEVVPSGSDLPASGGTAWEGLRDSRALSQGEAARYETPPLAAGDYRFEITGEGDADLYVRAGAPPTLADYDCRPYRGDATETCDVTLSADTPVFVMVHGYRACSFLLRGRSLP